MITVFNILKNTPIKNAVMPQVRLKSKTHWAKLRRKTGPKHKALAHFDDFYGSVFGNEWEGIKQAMLRRPKYVAVVNNYGDSEETTDFLINKGAHCLKKLMLVQQDFHTKYPSTKKELGLNEDEHNVNKLERFIDKVNTDTISSIYPPEHSPERLDFTQKVETEHSFDATVKNNKGPITLDQSIKDAQYDESRIIDPTMGTTAEALYQYIPATKLKGMDEWIPESAHYAYYAKDQDFPLAVEPETEFEYPEHLKVLTYEMHSELSMFPEPKRCQTGVFNYYPMDCGSVLAVLALCLSPGDRMLDLCSAPGGKSLVALQTLLPDLIVCNDSSLSRSNRMHRIFKDYFFDFETSNKWRERVIISRANGITFSDDQEFDKVLVDVPCTTDRLSVNEDDNNIFRPDRIKERLRIPELQAQLLLNALRLVKVGGAVVYSTCSLSPIQNDGVIHMALKQAFEQFNICVTVKDLTSTFVAMSSTLNLCTGTSAPKYGQLVLPSTAANFGPTYIARLVRVS